MNITHRSLDSIRPYENNPRVITKAAVDKVAASIREYGFQQPVVVDQEGVIIVGHTRYQAARQLGLDSVPVVVADLPPEKARAYRIADNRTGEEAGWDHPLLLEEIEALEDMDIGIDLLAFDDDEIQRLLDSDEGGGGEREPSYRVIVVCSDERGQRALLDRLNREGYQCRAS